MANVYIFKYLKEQYMLLNKQLFMMSHEKCLVEIVIRDQKQHCVELFYLSNVVCTIMLLMVWVGIVTNQVTI